MKKRQVMALILAAALALPNTSVVADVAGIPATVEAANPGARAAGTEIDFGSVSVDGTAKKAAAETDLNSAAAVKVRKTESKTTVGDVITVGNGWKLLNGGDTLKRGNDNIAKLRYTFPKEDSVTGNGWEKDGDVYYGEFDIKFEAVETIAPATVFENAKWPELSDKTFKGEGTNKTYWGDDLKSGSSSYGTFSVNETAVSGAGTTTAIVTFKLNPGYEFANNDTIDGVSMVAGEAECTKSYTVKVNKQVIDNIEWPELKVVDAEKLAEGEKVLEALGLSAAKGNDEKVEFALCKENGTAVAAADVLTKGVNKFKISASVASVSDANYEIAAKDATKDVSFDVAAPVLSELAIQWRLKSGKDADYADAAGSVNNDGTNGSLLLKVVDTWSPVLADAAKADVYDMKYQWYKDGVKVDGATSATIEVATTAAGEYSCEVSAPFASTATKDQMAFYKEQPVMSTQKVNVAFSDIAVSSVETAYNGGSSYSAEEYGDLATDIVYTATIGGASDKAEMSLIVADDAGKDVTNAVSGKISGKTETGGKFVVTVNKNTDAGDYTFKIKVKDGSNTVILTDGGLACEIEKKIVTLAAAQIHPVNTDLVHRDKFEKLTGFEYTPVDNATTDQKREAKAINDKITITVSDFKNGSSGFQNGYFEYAAAGKPVKVNVELKDSYKNNYKLSGLTALSPAKDDVQTATPSIKVAQKEITLGVGNLEIVKGEALPKRTITGADSLKADNVTVEESGWTLFEKDDKSQTEIKNAVKSLKSGNYIVSVDLVVNGAGAANYKINGAAGTDGGTVNVRSELTIYESEHTVGYVTYGDTNIPDSKVYHGKAIGTLPTPTRTGYKFMGWYSDKNFTTAYNGTAPVTSDIILYAKWEKTTSGSQTPAASAVKVGTTTKTSAGTFAVTDVSKKTVAYKSSSKSAKKVTIPSSVTINGVSYKVTKIENSAFSGRTKLTKVSIPSTVTEIGTSAFKNCKKLTSVTIPKNVTKIGKSAFYGCKKLKKVTIQSKKLKSVGKSAFKGIAKKSVIKTPKGKKSAYKKLLKKSGYKKTVK